MTSDRPCPWPERERLSLLHATGRLQGEEAVHWQRHVETCPSCAERAAEDARWDAALAREALDLAASGTPVERRRRRHARAAALAACALVALGLWAALSTRGVPDPGWRSRYETATVHVQSGRREEALQILEAMLRERREYAVLLLAGQAFLDSGRAPQAAGLFREALAAGESPSPTGETTPLWYVRGHLAQALLASARGAESDPEVERIVREDMRADGLDASRNRCLLWAELVRLRTFVRGDLAGGAAALEMAERENRVHREEAARVGRDDLDCHYLLHMRFACAQVLRADSEEGRSIAREIREQKRRSSRFAPSPAAADAYLADGWETEALAELLAARRGESADLASARRQLAQARRLREEAGNPQGLSRVLGLEAWLDLLERRPTEALAAAQGSAESARRSGSPEELAQAHLLRAQALAALGRRPEAMDALASVAVVEGTVPGGDRQLAIAAVQWSASDDPTLRAAALARLEAAGRSPLADVRRVAERALRAPTEGRAPDFGPGDHGFDLRP